MVQELKNGGTFVPPKYHRFLVPEIKNVDSFCNICENVVIQELKNGGTEIPPFC